MRNKTPIWQAIALALRDDIVDGRYHPGAKLPTESQLADRFGVNRHTVRHALKSMADDGLVRSRRGAGVYVTAKPTDYPIGKRVRFHENLEAAGRLPEKRILNVEIRRAAPGETAALQGSEEVCAYHGLSLADGQPVGLFQSLFPNDRLPGMAKALTETSSVTEALKACGVEDYTRASTRLTAVSADATQALQLHVNEGAPLLRSTSLNVDSNGTPVEYGRSWFAGERITLTLDEA